MRRGVTVNTRRGPGLMGTMARTAVIAGTATATSKAVSGAMSGGAPQQAAPQQAPAPQQMAAPAGSDLDQKLVDIQKLSVLKDQGLLTEEEFTAKKAQILGI